MPIYILGKHLRGTTNWAYFNLQLGKLSQNAYILGKHLRGTTKWAYLTYNWVNFPQMPIYTVKILGKCYWLIQSWANFIQ